MKPIHPVAALLLLALCACDASNGVRVQSQQAEHKAVEARRPTGASSSEGSGPVADAAGDATAEVVQDLRADDKLIAAKVATGLAADRNLSALKFKVAARDGVVTLRGPVPSAAVRARAEEIARNVQGVTSVNNLLDVTAV